MEKKSESMEQYAKKREKQLKAKRQETAAMAPATLVQHDPKYDLDTLTRAEEIKRDKARHRAAKGAAKLQAKALANVLGGKKRRANRGANEED